MAREQNRRIFFQAQVLFWMLCATDGYAKNFSLFLRPTGRYQLAPLYDVLSAYPVFGEGPGKISPFKGKMAMAVRSKNAHWKMRDILRRLWLSLGARHGIVSEVGRQVEFILEDLIERMPGVVNAVPGKLPADFPEQMTESILGGLQTAPQNLTDQN